jgi:hypothetical protein
LGFNTNLPTAWILVWAAYESSQVTPSGSAWGQNGPAVNNNNFFGQTSVGAWPSDSACPTTASAGYDCFDSFYQSALSALTTVHNNWSFDGRSGITAAEILRSFAFGPGGVTSQNAVNTFQAIGAAGQDRGNPNYGQPFGSLVDQVNRKVDCLNTGGFL